MGPFYVWLACFYAAWLTLVVGGDYWASLREHWGIAVAMAFGSYVAGATPMGGGTIGFPVLVLLLGQPATLGRDFSFAAQATGMTSAAIFILCKRQQLEARLLEGALAGSLLGTPLGVLVLAPTVPALMVQVLFSVAWAGFGLLHLRRLDQICASRGERAPAAAFDRRLGFVVGLAASATLAAITGVGVEMMLYTVMVLLLRSDLKVAIPTAVIGMAFTSLVGVIVKNLGPGLQPGVFENWLAAAPIVVLGAPLGAFIVGRIGRRSTLRLVALLCLLQFVWTMREKFAQLGGGGVSASLAAVVAVSLGFEALWRMGGRGTAGGPAA